MGGKGGGGAQSEEKGREAGGEEGGAEGLAAGAGADDGTRDGGWSEYVGLGCGDGVDDVEGGTTMSEAGDGCGR